jgi:transcriptional regulator NrdR family protein
MNCPHCYSDVSAVRATRKLRGTTHRRKQCLDRTCLKFFYTEEKVSASRKFPIEIIEKDLDRLHRLRKKRPDDQVK